MYYHLLQNITVDINIFINNYFYFYLILSNFFLYNQKKKFNMIRRDNRYKYSSKYENDCITFIRFDANLYFKQNRENSVRNIFYTK